MSNVRRLTKRVYEFSTLAVNNRIQAELLRLAGLATRKARARTFSQRPRTPRSRAASVPIGRRLPVSSIAFRGSASLIRGEARSWSKTLIA